VAIRNKTLTDSPTLIRPAKGKTFPGYNPRNRKAISGDEANLWPLGSLWEGFHNMQITATPMLKQYHAIKTNHRDCILFFRLGDFYEMFYDDAKTASRELDLVLTSRGKSPTEKIPMCGFPHHAAENYIARLIKAGYKVAICEQIEDPAAAKGIVKRDVTRIITAGTHLDENHTDARFVFSIYRGKNHFGLAFTDPATGHIQANEFPDDERLIIETLSRLQVCECVYPESLKDSIAILFKHPLLHLKNITLSAFDDWAFNPEMAYRGLCEHYHVKNLNGFGFEDRSQAVASAGGLLEYLKAMNKQPLRHMDKLSLYTAEEYVYISPAAYRGLELDTLIKTLDETVTPMGKRKFKSWFYQPLKNMDAIGKRQDAIAVLMDESKTATQLRQTIIQIGDLEKTISRLSCGYIHAKDILAVRKTLGLIPQLIETIRPLKEKNSFISLYDIPELRTFFEAAVNDDIPLSNPEGKIIRLGFHQELDALRDIQSNGRDWLKTLQEKEIRRTGINSLKIGYNRVFGYYIEITRTHLKSVPQDYIRKQTLANAERYITPELKEYEEKILTAQDKIIKIEQELAREIHRRVLDHSLELHNFCLSVATIDALVSLSRLAQSAGYIRPQINEALTIDIQDGRHPFVERPSQT
jgi:DNA mismatch repair protein MutS